VVDLLVVLVLPFAREASEERPETDLLEQVRVAERVAQRDHEPRVALLDDLDPLGAEGVELRRRPGARRGRRLHLAVDHAVSAMFSFARTSPATAARAGFATWPAKRSIGGAAAGLPRASARGRKPFGSIRTASLSSGLPSTGP